MTTLPLTHSARDGPTTRSASTSVMGTSVIALKYKDGVMMAADTLGSYGSLARFTDLRRIITTGPYTLIGSGGSYCDFQYIEKLLEEFDVEESFDNDGMKHTPQELYNILTRLLYNRRSKMDPLWNSLVIAGHDGNDSFLGTTDMIGTSYECDFVATGFGMHLAQPILADRYTPNMSHDEAKALLSDCLRVMFYRDCRTINRITFSTATAAGPVVEDPVVLETEWGYKAFVNPTGNKQ